MLFATVVPATVTKRFGTGKMYAAMGTLRHHLGFALCGWWFAAPVRCADQRIDHSEDGKKKEELGHGVSLP